MNGHDDNSRHKGYVPPHQRPLTYAAERMPFLTPTRSRQVQPATGTIAPLKIGSAPNMSLSASSTKDEYKVSIGQAPENLKNYGPQSCTPFGVMCWIIVASIVAVGVGFGSGYFVGEAVERGKQDPDESCSLVTWDAMPRGYSLETISDNNVQPNSYQLPKTTKFQYPWMHTDKFANVAQTACNRQRTFGNELVTRKIKDAIKIDPTKRCSEGGVEEVFVPFQLMCAVISIDSTKSTKIIRTPELSDSWAAACALAKNKGMALTSFDQSTLFGSTGVDVTWNSDFLLNKDLAMTMAKSMMKMCLSPTDANLFYYTLNFPVALTPLGISSIYASLEQAAGSSSYTKITNAASPAAGGFGLIGTKSQGGVGRAARGSGVTTVQTADAWIALAADFGPGRRLSETGAAQETTHTVNTVVSSDGTTNSRLISRLFVSTSEKNLIAQVKNVIYTEYLLQCQKKTGQGASICIPQSFQSPPKTTPTRQSFQSMGNAATTEDPTSSSTWNTKPGQVYQMPAKTLAAALYKTSDISTLNGLGVACTNVFYEESGNTWNPNVYAMEVITQTATDVTDFVTLDGCVSTNSPPHQNIDPSDSVLSLSNVLPTASSAAGSDYVYIQPLPLGMTMSTLLANVHTHPTGTGYATSIKRGKQMITVLVTAVEADYSSLETPSSTNVAGSLSSIEFEDLRDYMISTGTDLYSSRTTGETLPDSDVSLVQLGKVTGCPSSDNLYFLTLTTNSEGATFMQASGSMNPITIIMDTADKTFKSAVSHGTSTTTLKQITVSLIGMIDPVQKDSSSISLTKTLTLNNYEYDDILVSSSLYSTRVLALVKPLCDDAVSGTTNTDCYESRPTQTCLRSSSIDTSNPLMLAANALAMTATTNGGGLTSTGSTSTTISCDSVPSSLKSQAVGIGGTSCSSSATLCNAMSSDGCASVHYKPGISLHRQEYESSYLPRCTIMSATSSSLSTPCAFKCDSFEDCFYSQNTGGFTGGCTTSEVDLFATASGQMSHKICRPCYDTTTFSDFATEAAVKIDTAQNNYYCITGTDDANSYSGSYVTGGCSGSYNTAPNTNQDKRCGNSYPTCGYPSTLIAQPQSTTPKQCMKCTSDGDCQYNGNNKNCYSGPDSLKFLVPKGTAYAITASSVPFGPTDTLEIKPGQCWECIHTEQCVSANHGNAYGGYDYQCAAGGKCEQLDLCTTSAPNTDNQYPAADSTSSNIWTCADGRQCIAMKNKIVVEHANLYGSWIAGLFSYHSGIDPNQGVCADSDDAALSLDCPIVDGIDITQSMADNFCTGYGPSCGVSGDSITKQACNKCKVPTSGKPHCVHNDDNTNDSPSPASPPSTPPSAPPSTPPAAPPAAPPATPPTTPATESGDGGGDSGGDGGAST